MKLVVVDSSQVFRMGLRLLLEGAPEIQIVAECNDGAGAREAVTTHAPDLVITDLHLPDRNGLLLTRELRRLAPALRVLVLAVQAPDAVVHQAMASGASGYVLKWQSPAEILEAIRQVAAGRTVVPPGWQALAKDGSGPAGRQARAPQTLDRLSHREREIFDLVIWGYSNKQIAERLTISIKTVETHRGHINSKLRVHTSADMVRLASLWGILTPGGDNAPRPLNGTRAA